MTTTPLERIGELLGNIAVPGSFAACRTATVNDLHLEVKGVGPLRFPISRAQAQQLCRVARPARYGRREQTLLDSRVRNTWEIPKSRVKVDCRRWNRTLLPVLDELRADLGLPEGARLKAELHAMLVYARGHFFRWHQDSEKTDDMVGTVVVTLPSSFEGGAIVVEHRGEQITYRRTSEPRLSFVAFYADCRHEVRPVRKGHRIVLTYNLILEGEDGAAATAASAAALEPATVDALATRLRAHFEKPLPSHRSRRNDAPPPEPAGRLIYLLDHQYTERGLGWHRLKGADGARVAMLRAAAERAGCECVLALAEVHETWDCEEEDWQEPWSAGGRRWGRYEDEEWREEDDDWLPDDERSVDDPQPYTLLELLDSSLTLDRWIDESETEARRILTHVGVEEVCCTTPSSALEAHASEHTPYMGNYGNTVDRWYRRAAIVLWPRERAFAVRAEASPGWALEALEQRIRDGALSDAREMAASLLPFWERVAAPGGGRGWPVLGWPGRESGRDDLLGLALRVAAGLDRPALAGSLLEPFRVEALGVGNAPAFVALLGRYREAWVRRLLSTWSGAFDSATDIDSGMDVDSGTDIDGPDSLPWLTSLPRLCEAFRTADAAEGSRAGRMLLENRWGWLRKQVQERRVFLAPSWRDRALAELAGPIRGVLESAAILGAADLRDDAVTFLAADENEPLVPCLMLMLRDAAETLAPATGAELGLDAVGRHCALVLRARLEQPPRAEEDWSLGLPGDCGCKLCATLGSFLSARTTKRLEWPLAKEGRKHVHGRIDRHELPVRHQTRRSGSPYTLVLTKTRELFEREAARRRSWQADLHWLEQSRIRQVRDDEIEATREALIRGEHSGKPRPFDVARFKRRLAGKHGKKAR